ncbi:UDP-N-acetylglucosamine 2-epimerase [Enterobacter quasiroggenkampii]|uniref:UDP-N-acetylglucosamine 2-epimerase n=1 Tax=Enterobacter quasiroggenkampii TaxID=2497436 RepID=UPI0021D16CE0|nr:UDP-N-acetylglucosamine 2-epimerase [Enterobacter quasiroggenkampii]MCU6279889.1 UDP-N-acetylglucosamine 2-epimerase (hydrolyzing) [Enterobacter quasiroggenkampii]
MKKKILYVTGSRAEYGIMKRLLLALRDDESIELSIVATGMHCDEKYGLTYKNIENDGLVVNKLINININNSTNADVISSMSFCQKEFGIFFQDNKYDAVMLLGDRYEIFSVAVAAAMHNLPIIHLHGGEKTLGNYDEFIRHAITKMSRLHLASTEEYRKRIIQMGEHPETVINIGALGAENALSMNLPSKTELEANFGSLTRPYFVVVFHPETLNSVSPSYQVMQLLNALQKFSNSYDFIFIGSNSDTGSEEIMAKITCFCHDTGARIFTSIKPEDYLALNKYSQGLIGNSSSGLIEIPSLHIPTVNIGDRQRGRVRGESVIDCLCNTDAIAEAISRSQESDLLEKVKMTENPYYKNDVLKAALKNIKNFMEENKTEYKDFYDL